MKIAVTGGSGVLGRELVKRGCVPILGDITFLNDIHDTIHRVDPDILIHCAALTDVAECEKNFNRALEVNTQGTYNVVTAMPKGTAFIYISTDHVFNGDNWFSSGYGEWHKPDPVNNYGWTKWGGEIALSVADCKTLIIRTSKAYDYEWMKPTLDLLNAGQDVEFTNLIRRSFIYLPHLADAIMYVADNIDSIIDKGNKVLNIAGGQVYSYANFWQIVRQKFGLPGEIIPRNEKIEESPRPFRGGLDVGRAKGLKVPLGNMWDAFDEIKEKMEHEI